MVLKLIGIVFLFLSPSIFAGVVGPGAPEGSTVPPKRTSRSDDQRDDHAKGVVGPGAPETTVEPEDRTTRRAMVGTKLVTRPRITVAPTLPGAGLDPSFSEGPILGNGAGEPEVNTRVPSDGGDPSIPQDAAVDSIGKGVVGPGAPEGSTVPPKRTSRSDDQRDDHARGVVGPGAPETTVEPEDRTTRKAMVGTILVTRPRITVDPTLPGGGLDPSFSEGPILGNGGDDVPTRAPSDGGDPAIPQGAAADPVRKGVVGPGAPEGSTVPPKRTSRSDDQRDDHARGVVGPGAPETTVEPEDLTTRRAMVGTILVTRPRNPTRAPPADPSIPQEPADTTFLNDPIGKGVVGPGAPESTVEPEEVTTRKSIFVPGPQPTEGEEQDIPTRPPIVEPATLQVGLNFVADEDFLKRGRQQIQRDIVESTDGPNCTKNSVDPSLLDNTDLGPGGAIQEESIDEEEETTPSAVTVGGGGDSPSSTSAPCTDALCTIQQALEQVFIQLLTFLQNLLGPILDALGIDFIIYA